VKSYDADCVIVGAGCAGLSLATAIIEQGLPSNAKILLLDSREQYTRDHNWCFFDARRHPFEAAVQHRFPRWAVRHSGRTIERASSGMSYVHVPADRFYEIAQARIASSNKGAELRLGTDVSQLVETAQGVVVHTSRGEIRTKHVFDSRPLKTAKSPSHVHLLQHFLGHEIEADSPVFEPGVATLMDFDVDQSRGIHFIYVLPFTKTRALVESTFFTESVLDESVYKEAIARYMRERFRVSDYSVVDRERGVIPMTTQPFDAQPSAHVSRIGLAGGFAKPSTGYAFLASQRYAEEAARTFRRGGDLTAIGARPTRSVFLDAVFLSFLKHHPEQAPSIFRRLFEKTAPDVLVRFLSEEGSRLDDLRVMKSLPTLAFMLETAKSAGSWKDAL
jgi:lycopene beta-cyclase